MKRLLWMGCLTYQLGGFAHVILGALLPEILEHYVRTYSDGGRLIFLEFAGFLCGVLMMPRLSRLWSRRGSLIVGLSLLGVSEVCLSLLPRWWIVLSLVGFAGFGFGLLHATTSALVLITFKEKQAVAMSRLEVFFGLGALLMPFISSFLISSGLWSCSFLVLGVYSVVMMLIWTRLSFGELDGSLAQRRGSLPATARGAALAPRSFAAGELPLTGLLVLLYFCYVGTEVSIVNYLPATFVERLRASNFIASLSVTAYWLTMVVGRLVAGALAERMTYYRYLIWSTIGMIGALSALPVTRGVPAAFVIVLLLGLLMSGMAAVALIFATRLLPKEKTEQTASLLIAAGGLGGALMPLIVGKLMDLFTAQAALWFFCGGALLQLMLLVVSARMKRLQLEAADVHCHRQPREF